MRTTTLVVLLILALIAAYTVADCSDDAVILRAVRDQSARLPCGQGKVFLDGPKAYVLWLKNDRDFLYRYPEEDGDKRVARYFMFGAPCESRFCHDETSLVIRKVTDREGGLYRCRIHYQASPSVDYVIDLKIVESTGLPRIYDGTGEFLNKGIVGPFILGSDLSLICEVKNKDPETELYWRRNGVLVERSLTSRPGILRVDIQLRNLTRGDLDARYECLAQNADVSEPLSASVVVKMILPPMSVEIRLNNNYDFEAGQPRVVDCVVVGCMPPPIITWTLGSRMVRPSVHKELHDGNYTVSSLTLAPSLRDHHNALVCHAHNLHMPDADFQDKVSVNVGFRPTCQLGREERLGVVAREAETVKCVVDAYPEPIQFSWTFPDSTTLYTSFNKVAGERNRYTSTLTWLARDVDIGVLLCRATNAFGEQRKPCIYNISSGGPPDLPDCKVRRIYPNSLRVQCEKGWDGGRPQLLHLDIIDEDGTNIKNITETSGHLYLPNIMEERNLTAVVYASNARGNSEKRSFVLHTLSPISEAGNNYIQSAWMPYIEALVGAGALAIAAATITLGCKILLARREPGVLNPDVDQHPDGVFYREPDVVREERLHGTTNITVNQLAACQNQYSLTPLPACRVLVGDSVCSPSDTSTSSQHSYYV